jgi:ABC-type phosphate/phosphonate transport system substrate-binding protein
VVHDSPLRKIEDLRGKRVAFGSTTSTQGYLIPRIILSEHGIELEDLTGHEFFGSHHDCANAVISHFADACGMQDTMGRELEKQGMVRIIHTSRYYPSSGIAANKGRPSWIFSPQERMPKDSITGTGRRCLSDLHWLRTRITPNSGSGG